MSRFHYDNLIDLAGVVLTPSTFDPAYPAANLAHPHRTFPWKTGVTQAAENVVIDLGSAKAVTSVILLDHTLTAGDTLIKLEGNTTNTWGAPAFTQALTWASGIIAQLFASQTLRYWRLSFTKSAAGEAREIGRLFLGPYYTTTDPPEDYELDPQDLTQTQMTEGGQDYSDAQPDFRQFTIPFRAMSTTQKAALIAFADRVQTHTAFIFQTDEAHAAEFAERIYAKLMRKPKFTPGGWHTDGDLAWDCKLELREQL